MEGFKRVEISPILNQKREWFPFPANKPNPGQRVVIRMKHPTNIRYEGPRMTDELYGSCKDTVQVHPIIDVVPVESVAIASYTDDGIWKISPPYPRYDYSELSNKADINKDTIITHWAIPEDREIPGWETRFDRINEYKKLELNVDKDNEEAVYKALMWARSYISNFGGEEFRNKESDIYKAYTILCDLEYAIDVSKE